MADVITRLKLESSEYDSKIKRATQGLLQMEQEFRKAGKSLNDIEKEQLNYVRSLGQMQTVSTSVRGKIGELSNAYIELRTQYNRLTEEEKKGDFGKALSSSLDQLKQRVSDSKEELASVSQELNNTGQKSEQTSGILDQLAQKFTINIDALKLFELGMKAANVAVDVAKDAFFANEQQLDAWGAIVEESESIYQGFLNALNTGDINGFLNNINQIISAANSAYNALDALGTFNAFNQVNVEKTRTNMTESIVDYREGKGDKKAVRAAGDAYKKELEERRRLEQDAYIEAIGKVAAERGVSKQDLIDALSGSYGHYQDLKNVMPTGTVTKYSPGVMPGTQGTYTTYTVAQGKQEKLGEALRQLNDTELQSLQALGAQAQRTGNEIAQVDRQLVRVLNGRQGGSGGSGGKGAKTSPSWAPIAMQEVDGLDVSSLGRSRKDVKSDMAAAQKEYEEAGDVFGRMAALKMIEALKQEQSRMDMAENPMAQVNADFEKSMKQYENEKNKGEKEKSEDDKKTTVKMNEALSEIGGGLSGIMGGLEQLGVDLPAGMEKMVSGIQTVSSILSGIATVVTAIQAISAADTLIPFAHGGVVRAAMGWTVPGHSYADTVPSLLSSGEVVLNRAQQGNLLSQMESGSGRMIDVQSYVEGEKIWLGLTNYLKKKGRGEIVLSKK